MPDSLSAGYGLGNDVQRSALTGRMSIFEASSGVAVSAASICAPAVGRKLLPLARRQAGIDPS
jgi:hypothetical protein